MGVSTILLGVRGEMDAPRASEVGRWGDTHVVEGVLELEPDRLEDR